MIMNASRRKATPYELTLEQPSEEALCGAPITTWLNEGVDHIAVLVNRTPEILPLAPDVDEELAQVPGIVQPPAPPGDPRRLGSSGRIGGTARRRG